MTQVSVTGETQKSPANDVVRASDAPAARQRRPRMNVEQRQTFLDALAQAISVSAAADLAGVPRRTVYNRRDSDPKFAEQWAEAFEVGTDLLRDELRSRALEGSLEEVRDGNNKLIRSTRRRSPTELIAELKRRDSSYRDNGSQTVTTNIDARNVRTLRVVEDRSASLADVAQVLKDVGALDVYFKIKDALSNAEPYMASDAELEESARRFNAQLAWSDRRALAAGPPIPDREDES